MNTIIRLANYRIRLYARCEKRVKVHVCKRISYTEAQHYPTIMPLSGGNFFDGMRWKDYVKQYSGMNHAFADYAETIRKYVIRNAIRIDGVTHQKSPDGALLMSDGTAVFMLYRAWGDLMAAIWSTYDNEDYNTTSFDFGGATAPSKWFAKLRRANRKFAKSSKNKL